MAPRDDQPSLTRRSLLAGAAALPLGAAAARTTRAAPRTGPTVATWNLYLGVDLFPLFRARSLDDVRELAGDLLADARSHPYDARAEAMAAEIAAAEPGVLGVQEAALLRTQQPSDGAAEAATDVVIDLLDRLQTALEEEGVPYEVAASTVTTDVELPADAADGPADVRLTDRDALLVREGVEASDAESGRFDASLSVPVPETDRRIDLQRGYCRAEVTVDGDAFTAVTTHLESVSGDVRRRQAAELRDLLPADGPVVLTGDFNSGPGTGTDAYDTLTERYTDAYATLRPDSDGFTCCQASDLRNDESALEKRVDAVLYRGDLDPSAVERLGTDPADRVEATVDGETATVWPSDHAGVVVDFGEEATPTRTATATSTRTATSTDAIESGDGAATPGGNEGGASAGATTSESGPGFGVGAGLAGLALGALARLRR